ncbi:MAG: flavin reductase [Christensenellaceae bacterium]|jgi:flavorubredoxin/flavin reductase (DIM6/NTAB) family NADH-FMN oxidoreductase RutF|nr:flavin reductase [Christensenellaceae bacterium]
MYCVKQVTQDLYWVGGNDRRLALFENAFPVPRGISYNAYLLLDEKTVLLDTVDKAVGELFFENLEHLLSGRPLHYLVISHMEPDHCATMQDVVRRYPEVKIICNEKTRTMIHNFFEFDIDSRAVLVNEGDTLCTGQHTLTFLMAPMVHWPEVMVTYDAADKTLFSADAFGAFGALSGNIFADELNFEAEWLPEARRYYANIVGKYGPQVQALLKKTEALDIAILAPLHGPVWRKNINWYIEKYQHWAAYVPEETAVLIAYASVYGHTENAADILACALTDLGVRNVAMYDVSVTHPSTIVAEAFRCSHIIFASTTYNAGIFCNMETLLHDLVAHNLQNRTVAVIENGSWAPTAADLIWRLLEPLKHMERLDCGVSIRSALKASQLEEIHLLAKAILNTMPRPKTPDHSQKIESSAMFTLSYGLYVLTAKEDAKDNGCIINTVVQITSNPARISIAVNKANHTHDMILHTGAFNVSVLSQEAPFKVFEHFGFHSGRDTDKFAGCAQENRSENGIRYLASYTNAFLSGKVVNTYDYGTHTVFIADVTEARGLSGVPSMTYAYYFDRVKPKPQPTVEKKKGYVCKICGYVYEGDELPADFICPLCKHGAEDFERLDA